MKKNICIFICLVFATSAFTQTSASIILPKAATEVVTHSAGGAFAIFTEDGKIYSDNGNGDMHANANCYGDKATLAMYTSGVDFKKQMETAYNETHINKSNCCFTTEAFEGGILASWTEKIIPDMADDTTKSYRCVLNWQAFTGACVIYLNVNFQNREAKVSEANAKAILKEMIVTAKKTDFTKL